MSGQIAPFVRPYRVETIRRHPPPRRRRPDRQAPRPRALWHGSRKTCGTMATRTGKARAGAGRTPRGPRGGASHRRARTRTRATKRSRTRARKRGSRRWVREVKTVSTYPPPGLFNRDAATIARSLASRRVSPKGVGSGLRMLLLYINRGGRGLPARRRAELQKAKRIMQGMLAREKARAGGHSR